MMLSAAAFLMNNFFFKINITAISTLLVLKLALITLLFFILVVEWLKHRDCDQHGLSSKTS